VFQSRLSDIRNSEKLPDNPLIHNFLYRQKLARLADACQCNVPDAMLILSRYYQRQNETETARNWLSFAAEKIKSPAAMWQLAKWYSDSGNQPMATFWYSKAVQLDPRLNSKEFQQRLEAIIKQQEQRLHEYEK
jgi:TPR repeat protein